MRCFSCCFRIRDDNHTQVNRFSQPITAIRKETVDPLASSCVWSVLAHEGYTIVALTKRTQDGGTDVVEAKVGKGSATLSMARSAGIFVAGCRCVCSRTAGLLAAGCTQLFIN
ncbi:putative malate dehydrogenase [Helianthus annuus]|nr:putative malate dehydrogenase [Helianthus annuus]